MPVVVRFDPNALNIQTATIDDATEFSPGVATPAMVKKLNSLSPGQVGVLREVYDNGTSSADQTMLVDAAKGGAVQVKGLAALAGSLFAALTSVGGKILEVIDAAIPIVKLAGAFVQNDPVFGSPVMGSQTPGGFMTYSGDGIGGTWGGTGITCQNIGGGSPASLVTMTVEDNPIFLVNQNGVESTAGKAIGIDGTGLIQPIDLIAAALYHTTFGANLTIVGNAITIVNGIHRVGDGVISNINKPYPTFRGSITLIPSGGVGFTWNATGNIATSGSTTPNVPVVAVTDGTTWYIG